MDKNTEKLLGLAVGGAIAYELLKKTKEKKEEEKHKEATTIECPPNTVCVDVPLCIHEGGQCVKTCQYGCCCQMLQYTKPPEQKPKPQPKPQPQPRPEPGKSVLICMQTDLCLRQGGQCVRPCDQGCMCYFVLEKHPKPEPQPKYGKFAWIARKCEKHTGIPDSECGQLCAQRGKQKWSWVGKSLHGKGTCYCYDYGYEQAVPANEPDFICEPD